jgi:uncharacterized protein YkwD
MKKSMLLFLLLSKILFSLNSYGQTELDILAFNALNEYRVDHGVKPLVFDSLVWEAAEHHTVYLQDNGYPHRYPLSSGHYELDLEFPSDRLEYFGVRSSYSGECIASWGGRDTDIENINKVISQWDGSPPHKKGMLSKKATKIAISIVGVYWEKDMSFTYKGNFNEIWISGTRYIATLLVVR